MFYIMFQILFWYLMSMSTHPQNKESSVFGIIIHFVIFRNAPPPLSLSVKTLLSLSTKKSVQIILSTTARMSSRPSTEMFATLSTRRCARTWRRPGTRTSASTRWSTRRCAASTTTPWGTRLSVNTRWSCPRGHRPRPLLRPLVRPGLRVRSLCTSLWTSQCCTLYPRLTGSQRRLRLTSPAWPDQVSPRDSGCPLVLVVTGSGGQPLSLSVLGRRDFPFSPPDLDPDLGLGPDLDPQQGPARKSQSGSQSRPAETCPGQWEQCCPLLCK